MPGSREYRPGSKILFENATGRYTARVLAARGRSGAAVNEYSCRILSGPNMHGWLVDVPEELIVTPRRRR